MKLFCVVFVNKNLRLRAPLSYITPHCWRYCNFTTGTRQTGSLGVSVNH